MSAGRAPGSNPASAPSSPSSPCVTVKGLLHMLYPSGGDQSEERAHPALLPPPHVSLVLRQLELGTSCQRVSGKFIQVPKLGFLPSPRWHLLFQNCRAKRGTSSVCGASHAHPSASFMQSRAVLLFLEVIMAMIALVLK